MNKIFTADHLTLEALNLLLNKEAGVIKIKNFYQQSLCKKIAHKILKEPSINNFVKANHVKCIGEPHFNIIDPQSFYEYHLNALPNISKVRNLFHPYLSPIDKLRLLLDEIWPSGAKTEIIHGKKCFVGLCRILNSQGEKQMLLPHIDMLERDSPDSCRAKSLINQLACNVYLSNYNNGGELYLWFKSPTLKEYTKQINKTKSYHVEPDMLGNPDLIICPKIGDLILFSSHHYHAVGSGEGNGCRISASTFIGYRGNHEPLSFWS